MSPRLWRTLAVFLAMTCSPHATANASDVLHIAVNPIYPPMEFRDPVTDELTGFDIDLGEALAAQMHMKPLWVETSFAQMMPSVESGRTDVILSGFSDLPSRHQMLDFVPYLLSGAQVVILSGDPIAQAEDLCGHRVAASRSTSFPMVIRAWSSAHCERKGRPSMIFYPSESGADARIQLLQGRVAAMVQGRETVGYFTAITNNAFRRLGEPLSYMTLAVALAKNRPELRGALQTAFRQLRGDGTYERLLKKWSLEADALHSPDGLAP